MTSDESTPAPDEPARDDPALEPVAARASVRRAPRVGAFVRTGVLLGAVAGWVAAMLGTGTTGEGRTGVLIICTVAGAVVGALLGAAVAALADRRSSHPRRSGSPRP